MPWNPDTPLSKPNVSATALEQSSLDLWLEFLGGYFDGNVHSLNGENIQFPSAHFTTQQGSLPQPLEGQAISITWLKPGKANRRNIGNKKVAFLRTNWTFWIRAAGKNVGQGGPQVQAKRVSDLLYALLVNKAATLPLARKGIHHIDATNSVLVASAEYGMRSMIVSANLKYVTDSEAI